MLRASAWKHENLQQGLGSFNTMAFDGRFFYFADGEYIYIYSKDFTPINRKKSPIKIAALCYDNSDNCFWASAGEKGEILRLSRRFEITQRIAADNEAIFGLSYFCAHDTLLAAHKRAILEICKHGKWRGIPVVPGNVLSIAPYFAVLHDNFIHFYDPGFNVHSSLEIPPEYSVRDILFYPAENQLLALAHSAFRKAPVILRHAMPCMEVCECNYVFGCNCDGDDLCDWLVRGSSEW